MAKSRRSGRRDKPRRRPVGDRFKQINQNAEQLLGQMNFAIGQGADGVHISRAAIAKMRARYERPTYAFVNQHGWEITWQKQAIFTLRYFEVIGRLAAQYATDDGSPYIDPGHFERARVVVEATYREQEANSPKPKKEGPRGDICPIIPDSPSPAPPPSTGTV
jgi:hypothetical protein